MGASRVACASFNLGTNTVISITRDKSSYTHTLKYSFNGAGASGKFPSGKRMGAVYGCSNPCCKC